MGIDGGASLMLLTTAMSAAGAAASGVAASNAASYQAEVSAQNAKFAGEKAEIGMQDAATKSAELGMQNKATMGKLQAGLAASGLDVNSGSTKGVLEGEREITKMGQRDYAKAASMDWWSAKREQYSATAESELQKSKAESAAYAGAINAGSSLLGGASKLKSEYGYFS
jgi:hypothetical protein